MENLDTIKKELMELYEQEGADARLTVDRDRLRVTEVVLKLLDGVDTQSELLEVLTADKGFALTPVQQVERLGQFLQRHFEESVLNDAGIFLDKLPSELGERCDGSVLINSSPKRYRDVVDCSAEVTLLGKWTVDVRRAEVIALAGVDACARDSMAVVDVRSTEASAVRLPASYYQQIGKFNDLYSFSQLEKRLQTENVYSILDAVKEKVGFTDGLSLLDTTAIPALERGDQVIASDKWFTLVRNELSRQYLLFQHRSVDEVVRAIYACQHHCVINDDLIPLKATLVRDEFQRMPGERLVLGRNQQGEEVSLRFDMNYFAFLPDNLYEKAPFGRWKAYSNLIPMSHDLTMNAQIVFIKCHFEDCLKAGEALNQQKQTGLKR